MKIVIVLNKCDYFNLLTSLFVEKANILDRNFRSVSYCSYDLLDCFV